MTALVVAAVVTACDRAPQPAPGVEAARTAAAAALPAELPGFRPDAWYLPDDSLLGFIEIPAGPFPMGSDPVADPLAFDNERWADTGGQKAIDVPAFYIGRFEVTGAQFRAFVAETGHRADPQALSAPPDHPAVGVSWTDALAYARWLEGKLRASPGTPSPLRRLLDDGARLTLPTEAEWEKAARGSDGRIYPWGNERRPDRGNFGGAAGGTVAVGSIDCPECPYGLRDMSGNVWELTRTAYDGAAYGAAPRPDPEADALWVMRGGAFSDDARNVRAAIRGGVDPGARRPFIGFRVVISRF